MSIPLRTILARKGWGTVRVSPQDSLLEVADTLVGNHVGAALVLDAKDTLLGIVSERDIVTALSEHHHEISMLKAADVMSRQLRTCSPDCTITDAMQMMTTFRHRHIPVIEEGRLLGVVSIGDLVKHRLEEADMAVEEMRAYVMQAEPGGDPHAAQYGVR